MTTSYISENIPNPAVSTEKRFFQVAFFLPLVLPLIPLAGSPMGLGLQVGGVAAFVGFVLIFSLLIGGIPYLLFLVALFVWMRNKDGVQVRQMTYVAPLIFGAALFACCAIFGVVGSIFQGDPGTASGGFGVGIFLSLCAFILGYLYIGIFHLAFVVYRTFALGRVR